MIKAYHSAPRSWLQPAFETPNTGSYNVGLELELESKNFLGRERDVIVEEAEKVGALAETDASLDPTSGVEVIFDPLPVSVMASRNKLRSSNIGNFIRSVSSAELVFPKQRITVGMHINISQPGGKNDEDWMINVCTFFNTQTPLLAKVCSRSLCGWAHFGNPISRKFAKRNYWTKGFNAAVRSGGTKAERVEIRSFLSQPSLKAVSRAVNFVQAVADWVVDKPIEAVQPAPFPKPDRLSEGDWILYTSAGAVKNLYHTSYVEQKAKTSYPREFMEFVRLNRWKYRGAFTLMKEVYRDVENQAKSLEAEKKFVEEVMACG